MNGLAHALFGGVAQIVVGVLFLVLTIFQWLWWTLVTPPTVTAVFHVSMEALLFSAYATVAVGVNSILTERAS